uniref:Uncharacterized protein n=1 Tax=Anguilla anguilla TaxID=7936 RepID=A0A0E9PA39_ANGAN
MRSSVDSFHSSNCFVICGVFICVIWSCIHKAVQSRSADQDHSWHSAHNE